MWAWTIFVLQLSAFLLLVEFLETWWQLLLSNHHLVCWSISFDAIFVCQITRGLLIGLQLKASSSFPSSLSAEIASFMPFPSKFQMPSLIKVLVLLKQGLWCIKKLSSGHVKGCYIQQLPPCKYSLWLLLLPFFFWCDFTIVYTYQEN